MDQSITGLLYHEMPPYREQLELNLAFASQICSLDLFHAKDEGTGGICSSYVFGHTCTQNRISSYHFGLKFWRIHCMTSLFGYATQQISFEE